MFTKIALRDAAVLAAVATLWAFVAHHSAGDGVAADLAGVVLGVGFGVVVFLLHEWGHLLGGLAAGARFIEPPSVKSVYLFSFDTKCNSRSQFLWMSFGGFFVTGVALWIVYGWLPPELLATRVARGAIVFLTTLTVVLEFPLVIVSLFRYSALPSIEVFETEKTEPAA